VYKWIVLALSISSDFWLRWLVHEASPPLALAFCRRVRPSSMPLSVSLGSWPFVVVCPRPPGIVPGSFSPPARISPDRLGSISSSTAQIEPVARDRLAPARSPLDRSAPPPPADPARSIRPADRSHYSRGQLPPADRSRCLPPASCSARPRSALRPPARDWPVARPRPSSTLA
jgi:hypothetical protein